ncbi:hypothetical protein [Microbacterium sp. P02]|uniref:hypothetical protein n=1 Tax=unclassified Microbacterium TaxID=2609290 RepID=UPI0036706AD7
MGTSRRYAAHYDRLMDDRIVQRVAETSGPLQCLRKEELELDHEAFTRDPQPKPVRAWVRFGETPLLVDAEACSWTAHAVAIRFTIAGREFKTWVWSSAVREAPPR